MDLQRRRPLYIPGKFNRNRDKLFFFWNHEYLPTKTSVGPSYSTVPTALERAGNFSQSLDVNGKLIPIKDPLSGQPFPGNIIPPDRIALFRNFKICERLRIQLRPEFYNAFNHTQFSTWNTAARFDTNGNQGNGQLGQTTAARNPRLLQLAIRSQF